MKGSLPLYNLKLKFLFFYRFKQLSDYIYTDIYCKLSKCIGQTPCSYEHHFVFNIKQLLITALLSCQRPYVSLLMHSHVLLWC